MCRIVELFFTDFFLNFEFATYFFAGHLNTVKMSVLCDRLVENYRKAALEYSGVDKSSQAAADMAGSGTFLLQGLSELLRTFAA